MLVDRGPQRLDWHMSPRTNRRLSPNASLSLPIRTWSSEAREAMRVYRTSSPPTWPLRGWCPSRPPPVIHRSTLRGGTGQTFTSLKVKSTTAMNEKHQLRLGLGQSLYYRHALSASSTTVHATLYVERQPTDPAWSELLSIARRNTPLASAVRVRL